MKVVYTRCWPAGAGASVPSLYSHLSFLSSLLLCSQRIGHHTQIHLSCCSCRSALSFAPPAHCTRDRCRPRGTRHMSWV
ncbi:hypothetical protein BDQ12DRAFT_319534 [Crucibulum laeve]|uniref:Uncharacterized protein n=1 Tax=Crucibulum laeve TaxID=68775 RepID=A0A5C3M381_9AGAR|nr:hypothetical protein BDQ12DRAFT_319534 [Crucibulum laeve]